MTDGIARADPAVSSVEVFGFLYWITTAVAYVLYVLWAFTPGSVLEWHGITYYPSKYWAVAIPTWICVTVIAVYWVYESLNMIHTIPGSKLKPLHDPNSTLDKAYFSSSKDSGLLPLVEIPSEVMEMVLKEGIPPLEAEALYKTTRRRDQQISDTLHTVPGCAYLDTERNSLQIPFYFPDGRRFTLLITLPPRFPREPPSLFLNPPVQHPWIIETTTGEVYPPFLEEWPSPDLQLASVVQRIINALCSSLPPTHRPLSPSKTPDFLHTANNIVNPMRIPFFGGDKNDDNGRKNDNSRPSSSPSQAGGLPQQQQQQAGISTYSFPQLASMSTADIEKAMTDQAAFDQLLQKIASEPRPPGGSGGGGGSSGIVAEVEAFRRSNADLARANLARETEIEEVRRQIAIVRSTEYEPAKAAFDEKYKRQELAREQIAPEKLIERLRVAAEEADTAAASLEANFRSGALPLDKFIEEYTALRTKYHSREMKYQAALHTIPNALAASSGSPPMR